MRPAPDGFRTWAQPELAVAGTDLLAGDVVVAIAGRTARDLAGAVGVVAGAPGDLYADGCGVDLDEVLDVDASAAAVIADTYATGDAAMRLLAPDLPAVLWPEHFDLGIRLDEVNYGVSPGDAVLPEPYAYVGVDPVPAGDPFWNAPFGASRPMAAFAGPEDLRDFFVQAQRHRLDGES